MEDSEARVPQQQEPKVTVRRERMSFLPIFAALCGRELVNESKLA